MDGMISSQDNWIDLCDVSDLPMRGSRRITLAGVDIGVFRTQDGDVYAIENKCPHLGGPLSEGIVHDNAVTCPLHSWIIDLSTGQARGADSGCVKTFPVEVRGARVFLQAGG